MYPFHELQICEILAESEICCMKKYIHSFDVLFDLLAQLFSEVGLQTLISPSSSPSPALSRLLSSIERHTHSSHTLSDAAHSLTLPLLRTILLDIDQVPDTSMCCFDQVPDTSMCCFGHSPWGTAFHLAPLALCLHVPCLPVPLSFWLSSRCPSPKD